MRHPFFTVLALVATTLALPALDIPPGGTDIRGDAALQASAQAEVGKVESLATGKRLVITQPNPAKSYAAQLTAPISEAMAKNECVLAIIRARLVGGAEAGEVLAKLQLREAPYTSFGASLGVGIQPEWTDLPVTFITDGAIPAGKGAVVLLCGHRKQSIEIESIRVLKFPAGTDVAKFPRAKPLKRSYAGREPGAPWRKAALDRIEQHRKADLSLTVTGSDGKPLADRELKLTLRRHEFGFGSAIVAKRFSSESEDDRRYREIVDRLFSIVVFENDLKDGNWPPDASAERKAQRNAELDKAFAWLGERHIAVRGHYLMQVATPFNLQNIKDNAVIRDRTLASVRERLDFVQDRVIEWDVINHPIAWDGADMLNKRPGLEQLDREVFTLARSRTKLPFFVNEDQVFRPGPQCDDTFTYIQALNQEGLTVAGLGNQAHFHETYLPSPEHLLAVTDRFAKIVPRQAITEYDIVTTDDEQLAADYTRDVLIAVFSHPAYSSFLLWGFWEGSHWIPEGASWNKDWTIRPRGEVLEEWIGRKWRTKVTAKTDAAGTVKWRGFPGWYEVTIGTERKLVRLGSDGKTSQVKTERNDGTPKPPTKPAASIKPAPTARVPLWPDKAPIGDGKFEDCTSELQVFLPPPDKANGAAIVLCPGGGYIRHVTNREGYPIAQWLNEHGIATIILEYRLPELRHQVPLLDAQRAIRLTRANAAAWNIHPQRIGILGFSAGGHVASTAATHFNAGDVTSADPIERLSCRPDFAWLVYPVVTMGEFTHAGSKAKLLGLDPQPELVRLYSNETQVTAETPPAFLAHAIDDKAVPPENSRQFVAAMKANHVPVELLELPSGGHGLNGCEGPLWEQWKAAALQWLAAQKFMTR